MNVYHKVYVCYKGEELLAIGTIKEIAEMLKVKPITLRHYSKKVYRKKLERENLFNWRVVVPL